MRNRKDRPEIPKILYDDFWNDPAKYAKRSCKTCKGIGYLWFPTSEDSVDQVVCRCCRTKLSKAEIKKTIEKEKEEILILKRIAEAVKDMPFGESIALPWCRESFPKLDQAMKEWDKLSSRKELK